MRSRHVFIFALVVATWACRGGIEETRRLNIERGQIVISSLEEYAKRFGEYPASLQDVGKRMGVTLPVPGGLAAPQWFYMRTPTGFELAFTVDVKRKYPIWYYQSWDKQWHADE